MNGVKIANNQKKTFRKNMLSSIFAFFTNKTLLFGGASIGAINVISTLPTIDEQQKIAEIIIQIVIGIFTIIKIWKDKK